MKGWEELMNTESKKEYFSKLEMFLKNEYQHESILPSKELIFRAFELCKPQNIKVVIIGQDPYPTKGHANGLSFSLNSYVSPLSKSLRNIYKELIDDVGVTRINGDLEDWANQGVLLMNNVLTVREGQADSHKNKGWESFTDSVLVYLNENYSNIVYVLWGAKAQQKTHLIIEEKNCIIKSVHPSPLSAYRGFFGSKPFSQINTYLTQNSKELIEW